MEVTISLTIKPKTRYRFITKTHIRASTKKYINANKYSRINSGVGEVKLWVNLIILLGGDILDVPINDVLV